MHDDDKWKLEIIERLARMEAKLDHVNETRIIADRADQNARSALQMANEHSKDIDNIRKTTMWALGIVFTGLFTVGVGLLTVLL